MLDRTLHDLRYACRSLSRSPGFSLTVILMLALGIGGATAVYSVVDGVLLKPLSYPNPDELVAVWHDAPGAPGIAAMSGGLPMSPSMVLAYREQNRSFQSMGSWLPGTASVTEVGRPEQVPTATVLGDALQTLGIPPLLGRWLTDDDHRIDAAPVTLLGHRYWQRRFGGDPNVIGKTVTVDSLTTEIVGVMPQGFRFGDSDADLIAPMRFDRARLGPAPFCCVGIARLKPGVTLEQANADLERLLPIWLRLFPFPGGPNPEGRNITAEQIYLDSWRMTPVLRPLKADILGDIGDVLWVVMATIGIVLVIACANVTNLLLVRGERRTQELAMRAVLGAGRWRLTRPLMLESTVLSLAGGLSGVAVAYGALVLLLDRAPPGLPRLDAIALDLRALAFTLIVTIGTGCVLGITPALRAARSRPATALRGGGRGASSGRAQHRAQNTLVVGQVALALVLLVSSGLMIRTFDALRSVEPGFAAPETVQTFRIVIPDPRSADPRIASDPRDVIRQQHEILEALDALPGVSSAAFTTGLPMEGAHGWDDLQIEGRPVLGSALRTYRNVSPGYFGTMGTRLVAGRDIEWTDIDDTRPVVLISESLAREVWQEPAAALGKRVRPGSGGAWREIVGVVEDMRDNGLDQAPPTTIYWPALVAEMYFGLPFYVSRAVAFAVRSPLAGTAPLARQIEQAVWSVNPDVPVAAAQTMQNLYERSL
ncbi:MAG: ABC transporter permease, partial [Gammaproteobacteria bacterium]|nr:ABC transporter permease [Gammaproteobacteria bacterium]